MILVFIMGLMFLLWVWVLWIVVEDRGILGSCSICSWCVLRLGGVIMVFLVCGMMIRVVSLVMVLMWY